MAQECLFFWSALVIFLTLQPAFKTFSLWRCTDRCVIRYFMFSQLSQPSPVLRKWSFGKRMRSVAKNKDNWMITVRRSLVQSHFAVQSYPKEECGPICPISMGSFSLRSGALGTNFAISWSWMMQALPMSRALLGYSSTFTDNLDICHLWLLLDCAS